MTTALVALTQKLATRLDMGDGHELVDTLKATAFRGEVSDAQMTALMVVANQYGLNPWTKEIYAFPDKNNGIVPVVGVDLCSRLITTNQQFDGMDFRQSENMVRMNGAKSDAPEWIECIIYRKDRSHPIVVREYLDETYREPFKGKYGEVTGPWQTHPKRFLRHKAMIQCSRLAFGFCGIYDPDEAERVAEAEEQRPAVRHMGQVDEVRPTLQGYPEDDFKKNLPAWTKAVELGKKTPQDLIAMVSTKGTLNDEQTAVILSLKVKTIDAEVDSFVSEMEAAEVAQQ